MMRWLADENIPRSAIAFLRSRGEDTAAIAELSPGIPDETVILAARTQGRILVSFDRDHGDLIFGHAVAPPRAVVYLISPTSTSPYVFPAHAGMNRRTAMERTGGRCWRIDSKSILFA